MAFQTKGSTIVAAAAIIQALNALNLGKLGRWSFDAESNCA